MRRAVAPMVALAACAALPAPASAVRFERCREDVTPSFIEARCARVAVPLDRTGAVPGTIRLQVARVRARPRRGAPRAPLLALAGGPGQASVPFLADYAHAFGSSLAGRDIVTFDQRGTGHSGVLRCRELERSSDALNDDEAAERCAARLGPRRAHYTTSDSVEDIEAVRVAIGAERLALYGVSYGTKVALAYARRHPDRVERLVLDSVVLPGGPDPLYRETLAASARIVRELCPRGLCAGFSADPVADLRALVAALAGSPLDGRVYDGRGRARPRPIDGFDVATVLAAGDFLPQLRAALPGAVVSALRGDSAPLARLVDYAWRSENSIGDDPRLLSVALYTATACEELALPWARDAPYDDRERQAREHATAIGDAAFAPFDVETALRSDLLRLCRRWPAASAPPPPDLAEAPQVPILALAGEEDARTPLENAQRLAAAVPGTAVIAVRGAGHSVLGHESSCMERALRRFLAGGRAYSARCSRVSRRMRPSPPAPRSLDEVPPARGARGRVGRTVMAVAQTLDDLSTQFGLFVMTGLLADDRARIGGLRGGYMATGSRGVHLRRFEFVPGVELSGTIFYDDGSARLRVGGAAAARGTLVLDERGVRGRLGGRRVNLGPDLRAAAARAAPQAAARRSAGRILLRMRWVSRHTSSAGGCAAVRRAPSLPRRSSRPRPCRSSPRR